ncbi:tyrosine--tRNA ligase [bacterium]|nr:tyrosine--tRNA ligase [bacterium]
MSLDEEIARIKRGTEKIIQEDELRERLTRARAEKRQLRVKLGIDPTASDIHLGFAVVLRMLRRFQDLGHKAVLIIGNYTALVGDPSGKSTTRPILREEDVERNLQTYLQQIGRILITDPGSGLFEVTRNGEWFSRMSFLDVISLASKYSVWRLLERNDFSNRQKSQEPLYLHEMIYPLMQGWDSVMVRADIELGGTDQEFNLLVGRDLQERERPPQPRQICIMTPIVEGTDGVKKMSKSLGNYIGIAEPPYEQMKKTMQVPDAIMERWFRFFTDVPEDEYNALLAPGVNPRDAKLRLGRGIIELYHGADAAHAAEDRWKREIGGGGGALPEDIEEKKVEPGRKYPIVELLTKVTGFCSSNGEARRLIEGGGVSLDERRIDDVKAELVFRGGEVLRAGKKKYARLVTG